MRVAVGKARIRTPKGTLDVTAGAVCTGPLGLPDRGAAQRTPFRCPPCLTLYASSVGFDLNSPTFTDITDVLRIDT